MISTPSIGQMKWISSQVNSMNVLPMIIPIAAGYTLRHRRTPPSHVTTALIAHPTKIANQ